MLILKTHLPYFIYFWTSFINNLNYLISSVFTKVANVSTCELSWFFIFHSLKITILCMLNTNISYKYYNKYGKKFFFARYFYYCRCRKTKFVNVNSLLIPTVAVEHLCFVFDYVFGIICYILIKFY